MSDSWDSMRKGKEESYFDEKNKEALTRIKARGSALKSPVTGKPMEQITHMGVNVDHCPTSGGVWIDAAELKHLETVMKGAPEHKPGSWITSFFELLTGKD